MQHIDQYLKISVTWYREMPLRKFFVESMKGHTWINSIKVACRCEFSTKMLWCLQFLGYLRTLSLKFQKARTKIEVFLALSCWLSQFSWDSQQGRDRKTTILILALWNFKLKVLKFQWNFRPHDTVIWNLVKLLLYICKLICAFYWTKSLDPTVLIRW